MQLFNHKLEVLEEIVIQTYSRKSGLVVVVCVFINAAFVPGKEMTFKPRQQLKLMITSCVTRTSVSERTARGNHKCRVAQTDRPCW